MENYIPMSAQTCRRKRTLIRQDLCPFAMDLRENWGPPPGELNTDGQDMLIYGASVEDVGLV